MILNLLAIRQYRARTKTKAAITLAYCLKSFQAVMYRYFDLMKQRQESREVTQDTICRTKYQEGTSCTERELHRSHRAKNNSCCHKSERETIPRALIRMLKQLYNISYRLNTALVFPNKDICCSVNCVTYQKNMLKSYLLVPLNMTQFGKGMFLDLLG